MSTNNKPPTENKSGDFCSMYRVLGFGSKSNFSVSSNNMNGLIAWISGPYIIFYDLLIDKQVSFLKNTNNKIISCISFSKEGRYFATGEGNCKNGQISIYDIEYDAKNQKESHKLKCSFKNHKYGIEKICFVKNDKYIISIGNKEDKLINIFNISDQGIVFNSKYNRPIYGFDICDKFMVLSGDQFIKIYKFNNLFDSYETHSDNKELGGKNLMDKKHVDLYKLKDHTFICANIYLDKNNDDKKTKIYFMTLQNYLVEMNANSLTLSRWLFLKGSLGLSLCIFDNKIACGCSDGVLRIFKAETLEFVSNVHHPLPLGKANIELGAGKPNPPIDKSEKFPDISIIFYSQFYKKLLVVYSNNFFLVWDLEKSQVYRSNIFHAGSVNSIDYLVSPDENLLQIASCSDDKTVILWHLKLDEFVENNVNVKNKHISYSKIIRHIFYLTKNKDYENFKITKEQFLNMQNGNANNKIENENLQEEEINSATAVRFSPDKNFLAVGDNLGYITIFDLRSMEMTQNVFVFNDSVNAIDMIKDKNSDNSYLAMGGNDNVLTVMDISAGLDKGLDVDNSVFENLSSPIVSVLFCIDKNNILKLVTAESDGTLMFYVVKKKSLQAFQKFKEDDMKTYCLCYCPFINKIISGHNGQIKIWKTSSGLVHKHFQVSKGEKSLDNFRIAVDTTGVMFATSNNDKIVRIRALHNGTLLAKIPIAESISSLTFAMDNNYIIATSVEGYIYFLKINKEYVDKLITEKSLKASIDNSNIMMNKLKLLQKLMENDNNLSKNEQVKYLMEKMKNSEEFTIDDVKLLDSYYNENKGKPKKSSENIDFKNKGEQYRLNEDKPTNNDDNENKNNDECKVDVAALTRSQIFEIGLKEKASISSNNNNKNSMRVSLVDTFMKNSRVNNVSNNKFDLANKEIESDNKINKNNNIPFSYNNNNDNLQNGDEKNVDDINNLKEENKNEVDNDDKTKNLDNKIKQEDKNNNIKDKFSENKENKNPKNMDGLILKAQSPNNRDEESKRKEINDINDMQKLISETNSIVNQVGEKLTNNEGNLPNNNNKDDKINLDEITLSTKTDPKFSSLLNNFVNYNPYNKDINNDMPEENDIEEDIEGEQKATIEQNNNKSSNNFTEVKNTQVEVSESYLKNLIVTSSNFDIKSKNEMTNIKKYNCNDYTVSDAQSLCICINDNDNYKKKVRDNLKKIDIQKKVNNLQLKGKSLSEKEMLIKSIKNFNVNKANYSDLKDVEKELENLLDLIRVKNGNESKDPTMEKMLEKYSVLLLDRIDKLSKK